MSTDSFLIYRSSAGSGKTFTLTKEYLKMALTRPNYFKHILAVTFTNKATQEMKDRILSYLQELADGRQGIIYKSLTKETGWGAKTIQEKAKNSLSNILHEYSHFSVSTIDSFFQKVIRAFAKEMGLQSAFTIELDVQKALDYAIDQLMLDISDDQSLAKWLIEFSESRMDVGKSWDIRKEINKLGYQLFSEEFKKYEKELLAVAKNRRELKEYFLEIEAIRSGFVDHLSSIGKKAIDIIENNDLSIDDFTYKSTGMMGYFLRLADKKSLEPGTRARKSLESFTWCGAKHPKKDFIESLVQQSLHPLMQEAIEYYDTHIISYSTADSILKYFYTFGIMADLIDKLDHYRREEAVMLISDVNGFLKDVIGGNDAPFIYEKVGSFYRHFMIDEFQDTSGFQWDNFLPLIQNNLAEGRKNLVVGDVKQSIYRWRGGDWQLLLEGVVADVGRNYAQEIDLTDNWRSQPEVISFNNALFSISPIILSRQYVLSLDFEVDPKFIIQAYAQAIQNIPPSNSTESSRGYVSVNFLEEDKELDISWKDLAIKQTVRDIEDAQDRGVPLKEIAVLVRRNSEGKLIADALLEKQSLKEDNNYRYDVISPDSLFISGSKAVKIVISCLRFLSNREDMLSLAQLVYDYAAFSETVESDTIFESNVQLIADEVIPKEILDENNELIRLPVFDLCEKLIAYFDLGAKEGEISYLQGFQEAVLDFTREGNDDTGAFLEWWETYGVTRSVQIPESLDAIRIMTVHKSKGLQFGSVLVPFCNWAFDHSASNERIMWLKPASEPFNKLPLLPVKYGNNLVQTEFVQDFAKERLRSYLDNLNLLYVAFTRAENELFAYAPLPKQLRNGGWPFRSVADLLFKALNPAVGTSAIEGVDADFELNQYWNQEDQSFEYGHLHSNQNKALSEEGSFIALKRYQSNNWDDRIYIRRNAKGHIHKDTSPAEYGKVMHELLSRVEYLDDLGEVLDQASFEGWVPEVEIQSMRRHLTGVLSKPQVAMWFDTSWKVRTEVTVLRKNGDLKRLDRVIEKDNKAIIIDYKTGHPEPRDVKQVKEYIDLVREMSYKDVKGFLLYLGTSETVEVL